MYIIVGLGNPTRQYEGTKHNVGFDTIDYLIDEYQISSSGTGHKALFGKGMIAGQKVIVAKPMTYMNLSGVSLREIVDYYGVNMSDLIVIYDDFDLETGAIRIRKKGSAGSHNGMKSVIGHLGSGEFPRLRIGIGKSGLLDWKDFVIGKVASQEKGTIAGAVDRAADAVICILEKGIDKAMNEYNIRSNKLE